MKKSLKIVTASVLLALPVTVSLAATNKDRIGLGNRKGDEQHPQATETKQFCTDAGAKIQAGNKQRDTVGNDSQEQVCQASQATRPNEETRVEIRKIERNPNN